MDDLIKQISGAVEGQAGQAGGANLGQAGQGLGQLQSLLGGLMGGGGSGPLAGLTSGGTSSGSPLGGLALLPAILGMLGSQAGGNQSGLHQVLNTMQSNGLGSIAQSWIGNGASQPISPAQVTQILKPDQLASLASASGLPQNQVQEGVAAILPHVMSTLSPNGTVPETGEVQQAAGQLEQALGALTSKL